MLQVSEFEQLSQIDIRTELEAALGLAVMIKHDAKLSAYAEWRNLKEAQEDKNVSLVVIRSRGFGIGAGIIINGKIVEGQLGIAGEVGHMGINYNKKRSRNEREGTFEYGAGTESAIRYMQEQLYAYPDSLLHENSTYMEIAKAYQAGDPLAVYAIEKMAWMLGFGIANLIYFINPDCVILGPDYPNSNAFLDKVRQVIKDLVHPPISDRVMIRYSALDEDSFLLGGYYYTLERLYKENLILEIIRQTMD